MTVSLFTGETPATEDVGPDSAVTLGTLVHPLADCTVTHLRFFKHANNTGTHVGGVFAYNADGTFAQGDLLASVTFTGETSDGWQEQILDAPVALKAGCGYFLCVHMPNGHWSQTANYWDGLGGSLRASDAVGATLPAQMVATKANDHEPMVLGCHFTLDSATILRGAYFFGSFDAAVPTRTLTAHIYSATGTLLASGSIAGAVTDTRLEFIPFTSPLSAAAGDYVVAVHDPLGVYEARPAALNGASLSAHGITITADGSPYSNGVFAENIGDVFPVSTFNSNFYCVDVITELPSSGTWFPVNGGSWGDFAYGSSLTFPSDYKVLIGHDLPGSPASYFIDGVFDSGSSPTPIEASLTVTESPDVPALNVDVIVSTHLGVTEARDTFAADLDVRAGVVLAVTERPDVASVGIGVLVNVALHVTESADVARITTQPDCIVLDSSAKRPNVDALLAVAFLDEFDRFAKDDDHVDHVRLFYPSTYCTRVFDLTAAEYRALNSATRDAIAMAPSAAGLIDTSTKSNA